MVRPPKHTVNNRLSAAADFVPVPSNKIYKPCNAFGATLPRPGSRPIHSFVPLYYSLTTLQSTVAHMYFTSSIPPQCS